MFRRLAVSCYKAGAMNRGDIYLVPLDSTSGREQRGRRPVLIVSPTAFNQATKLPVVLPITNGGDFARKIGFAVLLTGTKTSGVVRCDQPRVLDIVARGGRKVESLRAEILEEVLAIASVLFD
jgi:mRNA interferase ChpB